jgi:hypothetical protein
MEEERWTRTAAPRPLTTPAAAAWDPGPGQTSLPPRGIRTLADLIGLHPYLLEELLDDLLAGARRLEQVEAQIEMSQVERMASRLTTLFQKRARFASYAKPGALLAR